MSPKSIPEMFTGSLGGIGAREGSPIDDRSDDCRVRRAEDVEPNEVVALSAEDAHQSLAQVPRAARDEGSHRGRDSKHIQPMMEGAWDDDRLPGHSPTLNPRAGSARRH